MSRQNKTIKTGNKCDVPHLKRTYRKVNRKLKNVNILIDCMEAFQRLINEYEDIAKNNETAFCHGSAFIKKFTEEYQLILIECKKPKKEVLGLVRCDMPSIINDDPFIILNYFETALKPPVNHEGIWNPQTRTSFKTHLD